MAKRKMIDPWETINRINGTYLGMAYEVTRYGFAGYIGVCPSIHYKVVKDSPGECIEAITGEILDHSTTQAG